MLIGGISVRSDSRLPKSLTRHRQLYKVQSDIRFLLLRKGGFPENPARSHIRQKKTDVGHPVFCGIEEIMMHKSFEIAFTSMRCAGIALLLLGSLALSSNAFGSEIKVFCTQAFTGVMAKLGPQFERETGNKLIFTYGATGGLVARVNNGEAFDVIIGTKSAVENLAKAGKVVDQGRTDIALAGIGVAVRRGAPKPDISSVEAFKRALLNAKFIAYTNPADGGASGIYVADLIKKLGMADQLAPKTKLAKGGTSSGTLVASGDAEIAMQMISELIPVPGVEIAGPLPAEIQSFTVMSVGMSAGAADQSAAKRLIMFLSSPVVAPVLREKGLEPPK
jgi:molybdate transport system substrate-binding protein